MMQKASTREQILHTAQRLFVERGYHAATLQGIADRVGITKPALYYHFTSKAEILGHLVDPMTAELEQVIADATAREEADGIGVVRGVLITGWLDVFLRYRNTLVTLLKELPATPSDSFERLLRAMEQGIGRAAGPDAGISERIAVAQAVSAVTDPVALLPGLPDDVLREHLLAGAWRLLPDAAPGRRPSHGGRPRSLSPSDAELARALHASGEHSAASIAAQLGVSRATVYRYLKT